MDLLLIYPPISVEERYARKVGKKAGGNLPPLGIASLAAYLNERGFDVGLLDGVVSEMSIQQVLDYIQDKQPKAVGISSITPTYHRATKLIQEIKKKFPEKLLILGGHHATISKETILNENKDVDLVVYGEGEITITEIFENYKKKKYNTEEFLQDHSLLDTINGIAFRKGQQTTVNSPRELIQDLDRLPMPARHLLPMDKYHPLPNQYKRLPLVHMVVIRGCPFNCSFCSNNAIFGRKIRRKRHLFLG
jgi:radical SAM superfamily enzyme YgiQ (UPF0313 family)